MYKTVRTTVQHRELHSVHYGDLNGKSKREGVYVHVWLIHFAGQ